MASSPFLRHVLTLVTGTAVAQAVSFLMTMVLARVYSPHDMGMLATYTSVAGIVMAVAALRYDMAVMLPRRDTEPCGASLPSPSPPRSPPSPCVRWWHGTGGRRSLPGCRWSG